MFSVQQVYQRTLNAMLACPVKDHDITCPSSHTNFRYLTPSESSERLHNMQAELVKSRLHIEKLERKIAEFCEPRMTEVATLIVTSQLPVENPQLVV